ncbi:uncharacterized protein LOC110714825 [Chenopodium quinoa]|uniref:Agglutinin domain-containing protein n=1 Tax=Chenopodium quinoa TaxID=63459 RepID=A0A803LZP0_CHEQI|nr:uncharacterized protein LOC110714825 [Chenopodium quinoa]
MANLEAIVHLPTYVALKATYGGAPFKYLGVEDDGKLAYTTNKVVSDRAKFAVESAGDGIVHIRSCYNNKYWVRSSESENWIVATSRDAVEDKRAWNCTLFRADVSYDGKTVKFVHIQLGINVGRRDVAWDREMYLCLEPLATTIDVSAVVDYGTIVILPQYVAFKEQEGLYLKTSPMPCEVPYFSSNDVGDAGNAYEICTTRDGHIYVTNDDVKSGLYWDALFYHNDDVIRILPEKTLICDTKCLFSVFKVDVNTIALRHLYTNNFLKMQKWVPEYDYLIASSEAITRECRLQVVEPVLAREVNIFEFHRDRARIYGRRPLTMAEGVSNNPTDHEQEYTLQFTYTKTSTKTWNTSKSGAVTTKAIITGGVPFIANGTLEIGLEIKIQCDLG